MLDSLDYCILISFFFLVIWLEPEKTLSEQGVTETTEVTLRQKYFFSDSYLDTSDLVQLNLVYIQVC